MNDRPEIRHSDSGMSVSIGAMSRATGIPANTLRTWERRYGFPQPDRTDSGQRMYNPALIGHLRLVARALDLGHRPKQVLSLSHDQLGDLLGTAHEETFLDPSTKVATEVQDWIEATRALDGRALDGGFRSESARLGLLRFLSERVGPFLVALGEAWRAGDVEVYQEHWASERLRRYLMEAWEPLAHDAQGPALVASTLPGDRHDLGLHMAVAVAAMCGWQIVFLGRDTPVDDIAAAVNQRGAKGVLLSISTWADPELSLTALRSVRQQLDPGIEIIIGGSGAPGTVQGVRSLEGLEALYKWASSGH